MSRFCPSGFFGLHRCLILSCPPWSRNLLLTPCGSLFCCRDTRKSILFLTVGFMGLRCVVVFSVQEKMGLFVGRDQRIFSLCLPSSAHLSASSFRGSPRCTSFLMKTVRRPCSIRSHKSSIMFLMMSASGVPDLPSPIHFWEEDRKHAESDKRITGFLSCFILASSSARHAAPNSALLEELPSSPLPSWQHAPLFSSNL